MSEYSLEEFEYYLLKYGHWVSAEIAFIKGEMPDDEKLMWGCRFSSPDRTRIALERMDQLRRWM